MSLPPEWAPLEKSNRNKLNQLFKQFEDQNAAGTKTLKANAAGQAAGPVIPVIPAGPVISDGPVIPAKAAADAKAAAVVAVKSVDIELLRSLKASNVPDQDLILIGAAMIANK